jgi:hypothetical protein
VPRRGRSPCGLAPLRESIWPIGAAGPWLVRILGSNRDSWFRLAALGDGSGDSSPPGQVPLGFIQASPSCFPVLTSAGRTGSASRRHASRRRTPLGLDAPMAPGSRRARFFRYGGRGSPAGLPSNRLPAAADRTMGMEAASRPAPRLRWQSLLMSRPRASPRGPLRRRRWPGSGPSPNPR